MTAESIERIVERASEAWDRGQIKEATKLFKAASEVATTQLNVPMAELCLEIGRAHV